MQINVGYAVRDSVSNFRRNWVMSLGAVVTVFLSLLIIGVVLVGGSLVNSVVDSVEGKVSIQVFVADTAPQEQVEALQSWLQSDSRVKDVEYVSKEQALEDFKKTTQDPGIVDGFDGQNPLPASLNVELVDPQTVEEVAADILANPTFLAIASTPEEPAKDLSYGQDIVKRLFTVTNWIRNIGVTLVILLSVVALIFIYNTIRLAIYARRKEIGVMRLVGASNGFIRAPFLVEGAGQALLGAILAILCIVIIINVLLPKLATAVSWIPIVVSRATEIQIFVVMGLGAVAMGLVGSTLAMRKYLKI